jgi:phosphoglycolate phosphatase
MAYKSAIFDLDGTLVDSLADLADATNYALKSFNQPIHPVEAYRQMIGDGIQALISRALGSNQQGFIDGIVEKMREKYRQICLCKTKPYKGISEVINKLQSRKVKLAVLTNKDQFMAEKIVSHFFGRDCFDKVVGTTSNKPVKPNPEKVLQLIAELKLEPDEAIFVGDSGIDIQTAKSANIKAVGVSWGIRGRKELTVAEADIIIDYPEQLLEFFN